MPQPTLIQFHRVSRPILIPSHISEKNFETTSQCFISSYAPTPRATTAAITAAIAIDTHPIGLARNAVVCAHNAVTDAHTPPTKVVMPSHAVVDRKSTRLNS